MKKTAVILLAILLCMPVCFPAFADMGGPEFIGYTATVRSDTPYYDWDWNEETDESAFLKKGTLPAGTELKIVNEYETNGEMYAYFDNETDDETYFNGYVRVKDLQTPEHESAYPASSGYKQNVTVRLRVTDPKGVALYEGPSATYAQVAVIPQGTQVSADTLNQESFETGAWMYLTYGGKSGWANCWLYDGAHCPMAELLPEGTAGTVWVVKDDAFLTDENGDEIIAVPKGEHLTFTAYNRAPHDYYVHVTYQGKDGFFCINDDGYDNAVATNAEDWDFRTMTVQKDFTAHLYAEPDETQLVDTVSYQAGDPMESRFLYYAEPPEGMRGGVEWFYVEKDGQSGWVRLDPEYLGYPQSEEGFTDLPALIAPSADGADINAPDEGAVLSAEATEPATEGVPTTSGRPLSPAAVIGVCIGAAAVLALTAFVTLRLIRRKKGE